MTLRFLLTLTLAAITTIVAAAAPAAAQELAFGPNAEENRQIDPEDGGREVIARFKLTATKAAISVTSMTVAMTGTGEDNGITVHVVVDLNGNGLADVDERSAGSANATADNDTVVVDTTGNLALGADVTASVMICYDFNQLAQDPGETFVCSITDSTNDVRAGNTGLPLNSALLTMVGGNQNQLLFGDPHLYIDANVQPNDTFVMMRRITVSAGDVDTALASLTITGEGIGDEIESVSSVDLIHDVDDDGAYDARVDEILSSGSFTKVHGDVTLSLRTPFRIAANTTDELIITYSFTGFATGSYRAVINGAASDPAGAEVVGLPITSRTAILPDDPPIETLIFDANTAADRDVQDGESAAVPAAWHVHASPRDTLGLTTLVVEAVGTGDHTTDIQRVMLVVDADQDGRYDPGGVAGPGDPILSEGVFSDIGRGTIGIVFEDRGNVLVTIDDAGVDLIIVVEFTNSLTNGDTFGARAVSALCDLDQAQFEGLPTTSAVLTVNNPPVTVLTVTAGNPPDDEVAPGTTDVLVGVFDIASNGGLGEVTGVTFDAIGDARDDLDITSVRLINDLNKDGLADAGDAGMGELTFTVDNGTITFDLTAAPLNIADGTSVQLLVVVDVNTSVPDGLIFGMTFSSMTTATLTSFVGLPADTAAITIQAAAAGGGGNSGIGSGGGCSTTTGASAPATGWLLLALLAALGLVRLRRD